MFKVNNKNTGVTSSKLTIKTQERHQRHSSGFIVNLEQVNIGWKCEHA